MVDHFIVFHNSTNLICRGTDISKYFRESLLLRDNECQLYFVFLLQKKTTEKHNGLKAVKEHYQNLTVKLQNKHQAEITEKDNAIAKLRAQVKEEIKATENALSRFGLFLIRWWKPVASPR